MPISVRDFKSRVIGKIKEKFEIKEAPGRTHDFIEIWYQDKKVCETHYSHGSEGKDIDDSILSKIKRQLKLDRMEQLYGLKNCPFKSQDYFNLLKEKNVISD